MNNKKQYIAPQTVVTHVEIRAFVAASGSETKPKNDKTSKSDQLTRHKSIWDSENWNEEE